MSNKKRMAYRPSNDQYIYVSKLKEQDKQFIAESKARRKTNRKKLAKTMKKQKYRQKKAKIAAQKQGQEICMCGSTMILKHVNSCRNPDNITICDDCATPLTRDINVWECQSGFDAHPILCVGCKIKRNEDEQAITGSIGSKKKKKKSPSQKKAPAFVENFDLFDKINANTEWDASSQIEMLKQQMNALKRDNSKLQQRCTKLQEELVTTSSSPSALELSKVIEKYSTKTSDVTNDETHSTNIKTYAVLASKHAQILDEWNKKTLILKQIAASIKDKHITEINDGDDDDEKVALTFGGKLYKQYMRCNSYMDHQAKRLKQS
eukprot:105029_1